MLKRNLPWFVLLFTVYGATSAADQIDSKEDIECLALNIYHEARNQPEIGQYAVAIVTMNRVDDPAYPDSVCAVVWEKRWSRKLNRYVPQFSWTLDGKPDRPHETIAWEDALRIAEMVVFTNPPSPVGTAKHYHASYVNPYWAQKMTPVRKIGLHIFYR
jgi:spore germination cell wall hydrolase CwlJ-like protein